MTKRMLALLRGFTLGVVLCADLSGSWADRRVKAHLPKKSLNRDARAVAEDGRRVWRRMSSAACR